MQTHDWEALLDGATPGPWKFEEHAEYEYPGGAEWGPMLTSLEHSVLAGEKDLFGVHNDYVLIEYPGNMRLAAAAPDAVAEVIRLRRGIEHRVSLWERVAEKLDERGEEDRARNTRLMTRHLIDILNGDTDE